MDDVIRIHIDPANTYDVASSLNCADGSLLVGEYNCRPGGYAMGTTTGADLLADKWSTGPGRVSREIPLITVELCRHPRRSLTTTSGRHRSRVEIFVDGGPNPEPVEIVAYDPGWPVAYTLVAEQIRQVLDTHVIGLDHIGSTSVPGLPAKAVIDIDLTVADSSDEAAYVPALQSLGFRLVVREPGWHEHRVLTSDNPRVNLHVFSPDCPEVIRHRMFRDWLSEHPDDRTRYCDAKIESAAATTIAGENVMDYNQRKQPVIHDIYDAMFRAHGLL